MSPLKKMPEVGPGCHAVGEIIVALDRSLSHPICNANEFFYSESLAAGSLDQLPAPLERNLADA